jgi:hypothetical protein
LVVGASNAVDEGDDDDVEVEGNTCCKVTWYMALPSRVSAVAMKIGRHENRPFYT